MEDLPPNTSVNAHGLFEPDGMCIWINATSQQQIPSHIPVLGHEFTHYLQTVSTLYGIRQFLQLVFGIHAGIQRLEEWSSDPVLPLSSWVGRPDCPQHVETFVAFARKREAEIRNSRGLTLDYDPSAVKEEMPLYQKGMIWHVRVGDGVSPDIGVPIGGLMLMEGMAVAAKAEVLQNETDIEAKYNATNLKKWYYVAAHNVCQRVNPRVSPVLASKLLCDVAMCAVDPAETFVSGLRGLAELSGVDQHAELQYLCNELYEKHCRYPMNMIEKEVVELLSIFDDLPDREKNLLWAYVTLKNIRNALQIRTERPLWLATQIYSESGLGLISRKIGSPVVLTNDRRLALLYDEPSQDVHRAIFSVRALSKLCRWVITEGGSLCCPYEGCPGCPDERRSRFCKDDARRVIAIDDSVPWCLLNFAAAQLRIVDLLKRSLENEVS